MNVLLLHIPPLFHRFSSSKESKTKALIYPPVGLLYIGKSLEDAGYNVEIIDFNVDDHPKEKILRILPSVKAVGISIYTVTRKEASEIAQFIKNNKSDIPIIIGGPHCTFHPDKALNDITAADICVEGEGEFVIKDI